MTNIVELHDVHKHFGAVRALSGVSFAIGTGEVHALLGENGAGKSTAMRIVKGEMAPTSGEVWIDGKVIERHNPTVSDTHGIAMVHQELAVFNGLSVAENLFAPAPLRGASGFIQKAELKARSTELLSLFNLNLDPDLPLSELTPGQKQIVEILRAVAKECRLVILDEPTSSLNAEETRVFLDLVKKLRSDGKSVMFVSHRIPEVLEIADKVTVLRDGQFVETVDNMDLTEDDLVRRMVGRDLAQSQKAQHATVASQTPVLEARSLAAYNGLEPVSFDVKEGEVLGVFGLDGSGTSILSKMLFGLLPAESGDIFVHGEKIQHHAPQQFIAAGLTYLSPNRSEAGLFLERPLQDSISIPILGRLSKLGFVSERKIRDVAQAFRDRFAIKAASVETPPSSLSGGNQQKVMMAACLTPEPRVVIANDPTRGVDVGAKAEMHKSLHKLAEGGAGIMVFSAELPELLGLCDRIMVLRQGRVAGVLNKDDLSEESIMALAAASASVAA